LVAKGGNVRTNILHLFGVGVSFVLSSAAPAQGIGLPVKFLSSCEIDLNGDRQPDLVLELEASSGQQIVALLKNDSGYEAHVITTEMSTMLMSCRLGDSIQPTTAGSGTGQRSAVPGAYVYFNSPEGASVAYYWAGASFAEVWVSD
jgi:hypothetical protein